MGGEAGRIDAGEEIGRNLRPSSVDRVAKSQPEEPMAHELLNHPEVLKTIRFELLRGGYPKEEVDDGVREVVESVFEYLEREKETIGTPDRMKAVVRGPSYARGVDARRSKTKRGKTSAGPTDEADAHEAPASSHEDRMDMRRALETMDANKQGNEGALMKGLAAGVSQKEIAAELGVSHDQLRKDTVAMRSRHTKLLRVAGYGGAVVGLLVLLAVVLRMKYGPDEQAKPQPLPVPTVAPPAPPPQVPVAVQGPTPEDRQKASDLRTKAHAEWASKEWRACMLDYFDADKLDPGRRRRAGPEGERRVLRPLREHLQREAAVREPGIADRLGGCPALGQPPSSSASLPQRLPCWSGRSSACGGTSRRNRAPEKRRSSASAVTRSLR